MNRYHFRYSKYIIGPVFSLNLLYEWGGARGLQPNVCTQNKGELPPPPPRDHLFGHFVKIIISLMRVCFLARPLYYTPMIY